MKKKLVSLLLTVSMLCGMIIMLPQQVAASSYEDVPDGEYYTQAVENLTLYGIIGGFSGYFDPNGTVTRAEFAKIASLAAGLEDEVSGSAGNKRFSDVDVSYWGNGYINTASSHQLLVGYPDGMFCPEQTINFAEAVTVILRVLGYSSADLGDNWPYAYTTKAEGLGISSNLWQDPMTPVSRANIAVMVDRALDTYINNTKDKLITKLEITESQETVIIATKKEDVSLSENQVKTDIGNYTLADSNISVPVLSKAKLMLNKDNEIIRFHVVYSPTVQEVIVDSVVENGVAYSGVSGNGTLKIKDDVAAYYKGNKQTYGEVKGNIEAGSAIKVYYNQSNTIDYIMLTDAELTDPVVLRGDVYTAMQEVGVTREKLEGASVIRDGLSSSLSQLQSYDVLYYSDSTYTLYAYCDKVSGVYEDASPNKAAVSSVKISGTDLSVETQTAAQKLGEKSGSYKFNDRITALLGKDGAIVDVVDLNSSDTSSYAILLSVEDKLSEDADTKGRTEKYVNVLTGNGMNMQYKTQSDYSKAIGSLRQITFDENGYAEFKQVSYSPITGAVDKNNRKIGNHWLTNDAAILEIISAPGDGQGTATARAIEFSDITLESLTSSVVVHAQTTGDFGDINLLVLRNVSGDKNQYGLLLKNNSRIAEKPDGMGIISGSYEIMVGATATTYSTNFATSFPAGSAVGFYLENGSLKELVQLTNVKTSGKVSAIDFSRIRIGESVYKLANDVQIYERKGIGDYRSVSVSDCIPSEMTNVRIYSDRSISSGGLIRVIVFG